MENLHLPDLDLSQRPGFNIKEYGYWSLIDRKCEEYNHIPSFFTKEECDQIIKLGKSFSINQSVTGDGRAFSEIRKSKNSWLHPSELTNWIFIKLQEAFAAANKQYQYDLHSIECLQFTEYNESYTGHYGKHVDKMGEFSPNTHRKLTCSLQLTDPSLYEGGELLVYPDSDKGIVAIKDLGTVNFFSSYVLHEVTPVTKGTRYSLIAWASGPKFK